MAAADEPNLRAKVKILVVASGTASAQMLPELCRRFRRAGAEIRVVCSRDSVRLFEKPVLATEFLTYTDADESTHSRLAANNSLPSELAQWAQILVIAPASANDIAKIANGMCDDLLTRVAKCWDYNDKKKKFFFAPEMDALMWGNVTTERNVGRMEEDKLLLLPPVTGRMQSPEDIVETVMAASIPQN